WRLITSNSASVRRPGLRRDRVWHTDLPDVMHASRPAEQLRALLGQPEVTADRDSEIAYGTEVLVGLGVLRGDGGAECLECARIASADARHLLAQEEALDDRTQVAGEV